MCGKMAEELLSLKWNNHQAHFVDILTFLREQEIFVDATLACGGKLYAAHKFVLSTCSDYFKQMFTKTPSKHPIVFMKDVSCRDLEALLDFMYNGEVNVPQSSLGSLIKTAEGLQIKGLAVPDDPPVSKRERDRDKDRRERDVKFHHEPHSPPQKRPRIRERSPLHSNSSHTPSLPTQSSYTPTTHHSTPRSRSPHTSTPHSSTNTLIPPVEATLDEDSRTSVQSGVSGLSEQNSSTNPSLSTTKQVISHQPPPDDRGEGPTLGTDHGNDHGNDRQSHMSRTDDHEEPSPGPSGIQRPPQSKEEEMEIKQEDVVDLGEDDEGDWGLEGDGGGGDSSMGSENPPSFPEVMLPHTDGGNMPSGDPAMSGGTSLLGFGCDMKRSLDFAQLSHLGIDTHLSSNLLRVDSSGGMYRSFKDTGGKCLGSPGESSSLSLLEDDRPFPCQYCEARFKKKQHLQNHMRIHTGEKYLCTLCGQTFSRMHILKHHLERKHMSPQPLQLTNNS